MLRTTIRPPVGSDTEKFLRISMEASFGSEEQKEAEEHLRQKVIEEKQKAPKDRHNLRMSALYVDANSVGEWNRPTEILQTTTQDFLTDAVNDYAGQYGNSYITPEHPAEVIDSEFLKALEQWSDRPKLPPPEWPQDAP